MFLSRGHELLASLKAPTRDLARTAGVSPATISRIRGNQVANVGADVRVKLEKLGIPPAAFDLPPQGDSQSPRPDIAASGGSGPNPPNSDYRDFPYLDPSHEVHRLERLCERLEREGRAKDLIDACGALRLAKEACRKAVIEARAEDAILDSQISYALRAVVSNPRFYSTPAAICDIINRITVGDWEPHRGPENPYAVPMPADITRELQSRVDYFRERLASSERRLKAYESGVAFDDLPPDEPIGDINLWGWAPPKP